MNLLQLLLLTEWKVYKTEARRHYNVRYEDLNREIQRK